MNRQMTEKEGKIGNTHENLNHLTHNIKNVGKTIFIRLAKNV